MTRPGVVLRLLCAGAAQGIVEALQTPFHRATGARVDATFGAVGALRALLDAGARCDVVVLTAAMIDALANERRVRAESIAALGRVRTGVAVREGEDAPTIGDAHGWRESLVAAAAIYVPDTRQSTAGAHVAAMLRTLQIDRIVAPRLREFANGAQAMRALADEGVHGALGCTQVTEITRTAGVTLVGVLPREFELATIYSAAVARDTQEPEVAATWVAWLAGPQSTEIRARSGFEQ